MQFTDLGFDYSLVTLDEGYRLWREAEGVRAQIGFSFTCRGKVVPGKHWTGRWIATGGMGNHGIHLIVPVSREAKKLVRLHVVETWANRYEISYRQANLIYSAPTGYKRELIADICAAIKDTACHPAILSFPGVGPGLHLPWRDRWANAISPYCTKSWPRNAALIETVKYVLSH